MFPPNAHCFLFLHPNNAHTAATQAGGPACKDGGEGAICTLVPSPTGGLASYSCLNYPKCNLIPGLGGRAAKGVGNK